MKIVDDRDSVGDDSCGGNKHDCHEVCGVTWSYNQTHERKSSFDLRPDSHTHAKHYSNNPFGVAVA